MRWLFIKKMQSFIIVLGFSLRFVLLPKDIFKSAMDYWCWQVFMQRICFCNREISIEKARNIAKKKGLQTNIFFTNSSDELLKKVYDPAISQILVVGGDGTFHLAVNLIYKNFPKKVFDLDFMLLGGGSGNDLYSCLLSHEKDHFQNIFPILVECEDKKVSYLTLNSLSVGFTTAVLRNRERLAKIKVLKKVSYYLAILQTLYSIGKKYNFKLNGTAVETRLLVAMNGSRFGNGIDVTKNPLLFSSSINLIEIKDIGFFRLIYNLIITILFGATKAPDITEKTLQSLSLEGEQIDLECDGEKYIVSGNTSISKTSLPIRVLVK